MGIKMVGTWVLILMLFLLCLIFCSIHNKKKNKEVGTGAQHTRWPPAPPVSVLVILLLIRLSVNAPTTHVGDTDRASVSCGEWIIGQDFNWFISLYFSMHACMYVCMYLSLSNKSFSSKRTVTPFLKPWTKI